MIEQQLIQSIAYCGLICRLCFLSGRCDGCKTANNQCERNCSDEGCYQRTCCERKGLDGCWQCAQLRDCKEGIYSLGEFSKIKAFAICMQEDGQGQFIAYVVRNQSQGLSVEKGRDYDGKQIAEVLSLLRSGQDLVS